jgi:FMN phosphatase YigB (HAD superfamily)
LELKNYLVSHLDLFSHFQHLVFSCDFREVKPEPGIYQHCLDLLQIPASEVLFLDDKPENVKAAVALGIHGMVFDSAENVLQRVSAQFDLPVPSVFQASSASTLK